mgnify:CR=1 FL=1
MTVLGYEFKRAELLEEALTTPSYRMDFPEAHDNQRLEFLGDAVLGMLSAERVFGEFKADAEGSLTVRRTRMVSTAALSEAAERHNLAAQLKRNRASGELPKHSKTLADAIEAIIGAAYLDGGWQAARIVFETLGLSAKAEGGEWKDNPKGELQVKAQAMKPPQHPIYTLLRTEGKAHAPVFTVRVEVEGFGYAEASAGSHKAAEQLAASKLLARLG